MRRAMWLVVISLLMANLTMAKPPEMPVRGDGEGRVPVYPDGEQYREPAPEPKQKPAPKSPRRELPLPLMNLLLPPIVL